MRALLVKPELNITCCVASFIVFSRQKQSKVMFLLAD